MEICRDIYMKKLISKKHNGLIKIVTGIRRCGKSYLLFNLFKDHLIQEQVSEDHIIEKFDGRVLFTRDTHGSDYTETQEGKNLPVAHCIKGTEGWNVRQELDELRVTDPIDKPTFGSAELSRILCDMNREEKIESITFVGLCTDICVISNVLLTKALLPEVPLIVDAKCCAGVTRESHETALRAMEACQVEIRR